MLSTLRLQQSFERFLGSRDQNVVEDILPFLTLFFCFQIGTHPKTHRRVEQGVCVFAVKLTPDPDPPFYIFFSGLYSTKGPTRH